MSNQHPISSNQLVPYNNPPSNTPVMYDQNQNPNNSMQLNDHDLTRAENQVQRCWELQQKLYAIYLNENNKYNYLKNSEQNYLNSINRYGRISLWRYKDKYYYRPAIDSDLIIAKKKEIAKEISSRSHNMNITIVDDLNDMLLSSEVKIDTIFIAISSIVVVENEVFDINQINEVFENSNGTFTRNLLKCTPYLRNRFFKYNNYVKNTNPFNMLNHVDILNTLTVCMSDFILNWLGSFFKTLQNSSRLLILMGNQDVSVDIFYKHIIIPLFGNDYCVTITEELLINNSIEEILKYKLFYHINFIPQDEKYRKKLRDIINVILVRKVISLDGKTVPVVGEILVTLDEADCFFRDFMSSCDVHNVDTLENFNEKLRILKTSLSILLTPDSLNIISQNLLSKDYLGVIYMDYSSKDYKQLFIDTFESIENNEIENIINSNKELILDPFDKDNFETLIPLKERFTHTYITGKTGSGKSEMIKTLLYADMIRNDCSIILIEPHSDLTSEVVRLVEDKSRLIYIDSSLENNYTPTINLFDISDKSEENISKVTQLISTVLKDINDEDKLTGNMTEVLENCISVLLRKGNSDFMELNRFMNDNRNEDLIKLGKNSPLYLEQEFFTDYFNNSSQTKAAVKRRLRKLLSDPIFSNLMNGKNTIDLEKEMNTKGKIIVIKIVKDEMPNSYVPYTRFILGLIQNIAIRRAAVSEESRVHTHLYIDEFQNFITPSIQTILTESRKYKLFLTLAHQSVTQINDSNLRDIILDNTNVKIIGKNLNKTLDMMNKTLNTKLEDVEKLRVGEFNLQSGHSDVIKIKNTEKLLNSNHSISEEQWLEHKQYQIEHYYRSTIKEEEHIDSKDEDIKNMLNEFIKAIKDKDLSDTSCLNKLKDSAEIRFKEIEDDFEKDRIRQAEISTIFNLALKQKDLIENRKFIDMLKKYDMFNDVITGTRSGDFTDDNKSKTEKYYSIPSKD